VKPVVFAVLFALIVAAVPAAAHHSFAAEFDASKPVTVTGTVAQLDWSNPHAYLYLDAKDKGQTVKWRFEMGSPNSLLRCGWTRNSVKPGEMVTVHGFRAKDGSKFGYTVSVKRSDRQTIYSRPAGEGAGEVVRP
jgi:Family of unknown function (DUF6152)